MGEITWQRIGSPSITDVQFSLAFEEAKDNVAVGFVRIRDAFDIGLNPVIGADWGGEESNRQRAPQESGERQTSSVQIHGIPGQNVPEKALVCNTACTVFFRMSIAPTGSNVFRLNTPSRRIDTA